MRRVKNTIILLVLILTFSDISAQNRRDESGKKQGPWQKVDSIGQIIYKGQFRDDKPFGEFSYFYSNGKLRSVLVYSEDGNFATSVTYYSDGGKMAEGMYSSARKDSLWKYFDEKGNLASEEHYQKGLQRGIWKNYYPDGKVQEIYSYNTKGMKEGPWKQYYNSGNVKLSSTYQNGKLQGETMYYYPDGSLLMKGTFKDDLKIGDWLSFNEKGEKASMRIYNEQGQLIKTTYFDKQLEKEMTDPEKEIIEK